MKDISTILMLGLLLGSGAAASGEHDRHMQHASQGSEVRMSRESYQLPDVRVLRMDGSQADFVRELDASGRPTVLNFIYTSCTTVCPMTTLVLSSFQQKLGKERDEVNLVSVSIDPEYDTPSRLSAYAQRFGAQPGWQFYTASPQASVAIQRAFGAHRGDKMNHTPTTFFRQAPGKPWVRVDGMASADDLMEVYRNLGRAH